MKSTRGFTLLELVIVVLILTVMSGVVGRLWIGMEKVNRMVSTNLHQANQGELVLERLRSDIESSIQAQTPDDALLALTQIEDGFQQRTVRYVVEDGDLVRDVSNALSETVTSLNGAQLAVSVADGMVRLEWGRPGVERPGQRKGQRLLLLASVKGARP